MHDPRPASAGRTPSRSRASARSRAWPRPPTAARRSGSPTPTTRRRRACTASTRAPRRRPCGPPRWTRRRPPRRRVHRSRSRALTARRSGRSSSPGPTRSTPTVGRSRQRPRSSTATAASMCRSTPAYSPRSWRGSRPAASTSSPTCAAAARRARSGTATACARQAERVRRLPRRRRVAVAAGLDPPGHLGIAGGSQRRAARRRGAHAAARAVRGGRVQRAAARHGALRALRPRASPGTTSTAPPTTPPSSAGSSATRRTTGSCEGTALPGRAVHRLRGRHPGRPAPRPQAGGALQAATSSDRPVLLRRERDVGHGGRALSRTIALTVEQLQFVADRTGLAGSAREDLVPGRSRRRRRPSENPLGPDDSSAAQSWAEWFVGIPLAICSSSERSAASRCSWSGARSGSITNHVADGTPFLERGMLRPHGRVRGGRRPGEGQPAGERPPRPARPHHRLGPALERDHRGRRRSRSS